MTRSRTARLLVAVVLFAPLSAPLPRGLEAAELTYQLVDNWAQLPAGTKWGTMTAVDVDSKGAIYVLQRSEPSQVMVFDSTGKWLRSWGNGMFKTAHGLRIDREDNVWVTERELHQVFKFSPDGRLLLALGKKGVPGDNNSTDAFNGPSDLVFGRNGDVFVSDGESTNTRVVTFSKNGTFIRFWGTKGSGPGQLDVPHSIVMDSNERLYVADRANKRVQMFESDGRYVGQMTNVGQPYGLAMTKDNILFVADGSQGNEKVTIVDPKTRQVLGSILDGMVGAHMLSVDAGGNLYVAEVRGESVKKFVKK